MWFRPVCAILGIGPRRSGVYVDDHAVRVRMGWGFQAVVPRRAIRKAVRDRGAVTGWGVHGFAGRWLVNGSSSGLVRLEIEAPTTARVLGVPVRLRTLRVSLERPDAFLAEIAGR
jgi:hypothetical protein